MLNPVNGPLKLTIQAHRNHVNSEAEIRQIALPVLPAEQTGTQLLHIKASPELSLQTFNDAQTLQPLEQSNTEQQRDLSEQIFRIVKQPAIWNGRVSVQPLQTQGLAWTTLQLKPTGINVEQQLDYQLDRGVINSVQVATTTALSGQVSILWSYDNKPIFPRALPRLSESDQRWVWTFDLPESTDNRAVLTARYQLAEQFSNSSNSVRNIPLLIPVTDVFLQHELKVESMPGVEYRLVENKTWKQNSTPALDWQQNVTQLQSPTAETQLGVMIRAQTEQWQNRFQIERIWIQTWLGDQDRLERVTYRIRGAELPEQIEFPLEIVPQSLQVLWNGKPWRHQAIPGAPGTVALARPSSPIEDSNTLELRYQYQAHTLWSVSAALPKLSTLPNPSLIYWQITTPTRWHLLGIGSGWQNNNSWQADSQQWGRVPMLDHASLEKWSGATPDLTPLTGMNTYLFSSLATAPESRMWFAPRPMLLWGGALCGFVLGLLIWHQRWLRHPLSLLVMALCMIVVGSWLPDLVLLSGQLLMLGLPLLLIGWLIHQVLRVPHSKPKVNSIESRPLDRPSTRLYTDPLLQRPGSTATAALPRSLEQSTS